MRIKLNVTVGIDPKLWAQYVMSESAATPSEIRDDVRSHFLYMVKCSYALGDANGTAEIAR